MFGLLAPINRRVLRGHRLCKNTQCEVNDVEKVTGVCCCASRPAPDSFGRCLVRCHPDREEGRPGQSRFPRQPAEVVVAAAEVAAGETLAVAEAKLEAKKVMTNLAEAAEVTLRLR